MMLPAAVPSLELFPVAPAGSHNNRLEPDSRSGSETRSSTSSSAAGDYGSPANRLSQCSLQGRIERAEKPGPVTLGERKWAARIRSELPEVPRYLTADESVTNIRLGPSFANGGGDARPLAASAASLSRARDIGCANGLRYVYTGNVHDRTGGSTWCRGCGRLLIGRDWFELTRWYLVEEGCCMDCGTPLPGVFEARPGNWGARRQPVLLRQ